MIALTEAAENGRPRTPAGCWAHQRMNDADLVGANADQVRKGPPNPALAHVSGAHKRTDCSHSARSPDRIRSHGWEVRYRVPCVANSPALPGQQTRSRAQML